jgi:hypothetical protein
MSMAVAVGSEFLVPGIVAGQPVVWATADRGGSWTAEVIPAQGLVGLGNLSVTSTGSFFTGHLATDRDWDAAIWRRAGLGSWERLARAEPEFEDPERFADVTQIVGFEGGLLAIGSAGERAPCDALGMGGGRGGGIASVARPLLDTCADMPAAAWVSADAEQWDPIEGPRPAGWRGGTVYLGDVVTGADGLVGLINESPDGGNPAYGVWSSANGREWRRIGGEFARGNAFPQGTFAFPDRLVVLGGTEDGHVTTWIGEAATDP